MNRKNRDDGFFKKGGGGREMSDERFGMVRREGHDKKKGTFRLVYA